MSDPGQTRAQGSAPFALGGGWHEREAAWLAPYAMHSADSAGRRYREPAHDYRAPYQRDRDRVTHCASFRRLSFKTQVFMGDEGDYHRTRLAHTLEVASIARTLARALRLNEDLVEALALTHDLGHPPFGHAGEDVLDECLAEVGGFSHNRYALCLVEELEQRYPEFPGLNLTAETLEGQASRADKAAAALRPLLEAQAVEAADSVAYDTHDADDALELGLLTLDELLATPLWAEAARRVRLRWTSMTPKELTRAVLRELIDWQVSDLLVGAEHGLTAQGVTSVAAVRQAELLIRPSAELAEPKANLERLLAERVYRHPQVVTSRRRVQDVLRALFARYVEQPDRMPATFQRRAANLGVQRAVGDYLAGMTDRYARQQFERLGL